MSTPVNQARALFLEAIEQPDAAALGRFIAHTCGDDADLQLRGERLLESHEKLGSFHDQPPSPAATAMDNDYVAKSGTLVFAPGVTSQTISVQVKGDKKKESNERFFVDLSGVWNETIASARGIGEILDDDSPGGKGNAR